MKYITREMLERADVCYDQQRLFNCTFGTKAELTTDNVAKAIEAGLDFTWLTQLLPQSMREAYESQRELLWKAYEASYAPLLKTYKAQCWRMLGDEAQRAPLWEDYMAQRATLRKAYESQRNTLLLNALLAA